MKKLLFFLLLISSTAYGQDLTVTPTGIIKNNTLDLGVYSLKTEVTELQAALYTLQVKVNSMVAGGIVQPNQQSSNYTLKASDNGATVVMNCNRCTVTLPSLTAGVKCFIVAPKGTVYFATTGIGFQTGSSKSMTINSRPVMVDYLTQTVNVR